MFFKSPNVSELSHPNPNRNKMWFISPRANRVLEPGSDQGSQGNQKRKACHFRGMWRGGGGAREVVQEAALSKSLEGCRVGREGLWEARSKCKHIYGDC